MATNSARGNPIGAADGPKIEMSPPPVPSDVKSQVQSTQTTGSTGTHASGQDHGAVSLGAKVETERELEQSKSG